MTSQADLVVWAHESFGGEMIRTVQEIVERAALLRTELDEARAQINMPIPELTAAVNLIEDKVRAQIADLRETLAFLESSEVAASDSPYARRLRALLPGMDRVLCQMTEDAERFSDI